MHNDFILEKKNYNTICGADFRAHIFFVLCKTSPLTELPLILLGFFVDNIFVSCLFV